MKFNSNALLEAKLEAEDVETCDECGANLADDAGEGYDGLCGACADVAEKEGRWS